MFGSSIGTVPECSSNRAESDSNESPYYHFGGTSWLIPKTHQLCSLFPLVEYKNHFWKPTNPHIFSNPEVRRQTGSYFSALPAHIANWYPQPDSLVIAGLEEATHALQDFDVYSLLRFGNEKTRLRAMSSVLLRTESFFLE